jgi:hypothetical protein
MAAARKDTASNVGWEKYGMAGEHMRITTLFLITL